MRMCASLSLLLFCIAIAALPAAGQDVFATPDPEVIPVLVVPGWSDHAPTVEPIRRNLIDAGWPATRVDAMSFRDAVGSNEDHAREIGLAVERLRARTGSAEIDIVAHSMGGLAVRQYLAFHGGEEVVRRAIFLGTPHRGTLAAMLAWGEGGREMVPGTDFLTKLNSEKGRIQETELLAVRTPVDFRVIPSSSGLLPGVLNLEICCPSHTQLVEDRRTFEVVADFLREGAEGVPDAAIPAERPEWAGSGRFGEWSPWGDGVAESTVRWWFFPSWRDRDRRDPGGGG